MYGGFEFHSWISLRTFFGRFDAGAQCSCLRSEGQHLPEHQRGLKQSQIVYSSDNVVPGTSAGDARARSRVQKV